MKRIAVAAGLLLLGAVAVARAQSPAIPSAHRSAVGVHPPARVAKAKKKPRKRAAPAPPLPPLTTPPPLTTATPAPGPSPPPPVAPPPSVALPPLPSAGRPDSAPPVEGEAAVVVKPPSVSPPPDRAESRAPGPTPSTEAEQKLPTITLLVEPEWAYRRFLDIEPSATNKHFGTPGVFLLGGRAELYPFAPGNGPLRDLGMMGSYARALFLASGGLTTTDLNSSKDVETRWFRYSAGLKYRLFGRSGPFALGVELGFQRWVFDFDLPVVPTREIPTARYSFVGAGADARYSIGRVSLVFDATYLYPLWIDPLGDRRAAQQGYGVRGGLGAALTLGAFEAELRASFTLVRLALDPAPGRSDEPGRVFDQYFGARLGVGARF